jgi:PAS domain S-box-containing protein
MARKPTYEELEKRVRELENRIADCLRKPAESSVQQDLSDRKMVEEELRLSEQKFQNLAENVPGLVLKYKLNPDGSDELLYISKSVEDLFEVSREDAFNNNKLLWDRIHGDDLEEYIGSIKTSAENLSLWEQEHRIQLPGGRIKWLYTRGVPVQEDDGGVVWNTVALDITKQKQTEEALRHKHKMSQRTEAIAKVGSWEWEIAADTVTWSKELYHIFQLDPDAEAPSWAEHSKLYHPEDFEKLRQAVETAIADGKPYEVELRVSRKDGETRICKAIGFPENGEKGQVVRLFGLLQDVTEHKRSEDALLKSKRELQQTLDATTDGIWTWNFRTDELFFSPKYYSMLGYEPDEFSAEYENWVNLIHPQDRDRAIAIAEQYLEKKPDIYENEFRLRTKYGDYRWMRTHARVVERDEKGEAVFMIGNHEDITERKRAEWEMRRSEAFLNSIIEHSPHAMWISDDKGTLIRLNQACRELLNITDDEVVGKYNLLQDDIVEGQGYMPLVNKVFTKGEKAEFTLEYDSSQLRNLAPKQAVRVILEVTISPVLDAGGRVTNAIIQHVDITERKLYEDQLQQSEERFRLVIKGSNDAPWDWDLIANDLYYSPQWWAQIGYGPDELSADAALWQRLMHPDDADRVNSFFQNALEDGTESYEVEFRLLHKEGHYVPVLSRGFITRNEAGKPIRVSGTNMDLTEHRQAEEALRKSETLLREAQRVARIGHWELDSPSGTPVWSEEIFHIFGLDPKTSEPSFTAHKNIIHEDDWGVLESAISELSARGKPFDLEFRIKTASGDIGWMHAIGSANKDEEGNVTRMFGTAQDITNRKNIEEALRKSEEKFSKFFYSSPTWVAFTRLPDGKFLEINRAFEKITGFSRDEVLGRNSLEIGLWRETEKRERLMKEARKKAVSRSKKLRSLPEKARTPAAQNGSHRQSGRRHCP